MPIDGWVGLLAWERQKYPGVCGCGHSVCLGAHESQTEKNRSAAASFNYEIKSCKM